MNDTTQGFLGSGATPHAVCHEGRTYHFRRLDQRAMEAVSAWAIARTRKAIVTVYEGEAQTEKLAELQREIVSGAYEFYEDSISGRLNQDTGKVEGGLLFTKPGLLAMLGILCGCPEGELIGLLAAKRDEVMHVLQLVLAESVPGYGRPPDPNPRAAQDPAA